MKIGEFFKDKGVFLGVNVIVFLIVAAVNISFDINSVIIIIIWCIWFLPLSSYMIMDYIKYRRYFKNIEDTLKI